MRTTALLSPLVVTLGAVAAAEAAPPARPEVPVRWHVMGGYVEPLGQTADYLQGGYLVGGGLSITPAPGSPLSVRFDLSYNAHNASNKLLDIGQQSTGVQIDSGTGSVGSLTGNLVLSAPFGYAVRGYVLGGVGVYHARVELTQTVLFGGVFCDPYYDICYSGLSAGAAVVAARSTTRLGWNAGLGLEFGSGYGPSWFIEARYHRVETQHPLQYLPVTVGFRF